MRVFNFSPGPAVLPVPILEQAQSELVEYKNDGMSVMEMSHRSSMFMDIMESTKSSLCSLMNLPDNYKILFLQGGASLQFAQVPMNLMHSGKADYIVSGLFAKKAAAEAEKYGEVRVLASSADRNFTYIPEVDMKDVHADSDYLHITTNNTIYGTSFRSNIPKSPIPLVGDMSSDILAEPVDFSRFGLIYAGAQKNIGPAGLTIVIIRDDLISDPIAQYVPTMLSYKVQAENDSMYNTPPTYSVYMAGLMFEWLLKNGGLEQAKSRNEHKANLLYNALDESSLFTPTADKEYRSIMNVTFVASSPELDAKFVAEAGKNGLVNLKGHRSVGGMRASIYNAMPLEGVEKLVSFIQVFDKNNK